MGPPLSFGGSSCATRLRRSHCLLLDQSPRLSGPSSRTRGSVDAAGENVEQPIVQVVLLRRVQRSRSDPSFYIRNPEPNPKNRPNREVFLHFFGMEVTWK